jgi:hypothetical protein
VSDLESRASERAFLREYGGDPRRAAAHLLGVGFDRYLLLARPVEAPRGASIQEREAIAAQRPTEPEPRWRRVTGFRSEPQASPQDMVLDHIQNGRHTTTVRERWHAFWALPVTGIEEVFRVADMLDARHDAWGLWDTVDGRMARLFGSPVDHWTITRLEEGWLTPRDGPPVDLSMPGPRGFRQEFEDAYSRGMEAAERALRLSSDATESFQMLPPPEGVVTRWTAPEDPLARATLRGDNVARVAPVTRCGGCGNPTTVYVDGSVGDPFGGEHVCPDAPRCRDCERALESGTTSPGGRCPPCASIASGHGL